MRPSDISKVRNRIIYELLKHIRHIVSEALNRRDDTKRIKAQTSLGLYVHENANTMIEIESEVRELMDSFSDDDILSAVTMEMAREVSNRIDREFIVIMPKDALFRLNILTRKEIERRGYMGEAELKIYKPNQPLMEATK